jgi:hypothetical protein
MQTKYFIFQVDFPSSINFRNSTGGTRWINDNTFADSVEEALEIHMDKHAEQYGLSKEVLVGALWFDTKTGDKSCYAIGDKMAFLSDFTIMAIPEEVVVGNYNFAKAAYKDGALGFHDICNDKLVAELLEKREQQKIFREEQQQRSHRNYLKN